MVGDVESKNSRLSLRMGADRPIAYPRLGIRALPRVRRPKVTGVRVMVLMLMVAAVTLPMAINSPGNAHASYTTTIATDALNLRDVPSTDGEVLTKMYQDEEVEVLDGPIDGGWYEVTYGDLTGYAFGEYLDLGGVGGGSGGERWIDVDRSSERVTLYEGDTLIASYWAAMSWDKTDDGFYATANGSYTVYAMNADLTWTDYGGAYITDWVAFDPDRANGFHSWSLDKNGYLLSGGEGPTGGCVALDPEFADALFDFADIGMRVEVHW
jgi:hypothetical protein